MNMANRERVTLLLISAEFNGYKIFQRELDVRNWTMPLKREINQEKFSFENLKTKVNKLPE